jgi:hypothetical protein
MPGAEAVLGVLSTVVVPETVEEVEVTVFVWASA